MPCERIKRVAQHVSKSLSELHEKLSPRVDLSVGIVYYRNPSAPFGIEMLAERKKYREKREKDLKLPGGHIEKTDSSREDAFVREFFEETGVLIEKDNLVPLSSVKVINRRRRRIHEVVHLHAFAVEVSEKQNFTPQDGEDIDGYEWVTIPEFKERTLKESYRNNIFRWAEEIQADTKLTRLSSFQTMPLAVPQL